ncbi:hypothetical protein [Chryseobacterium viscerum]|nr:hypothetical protein [Chryseobacterium viscerum]
MENLEMLTDEESMNIDAGGGFWYDVAYGLGRFAKGYWEHAGRWGGTAAL